MNFIKKNAFFAQSTKLPGVNKIFTIEVHSISKNILTNLQPKTLLKHAQIVDVVDSKMTSL